MEKENLNKDINLDEKQEAENNDKKDGVETKELNPEDTKELTPEEKIAELEDKLTRTFAEMENQRRRYDKEKDDAFEYGGFAFAKEALNLLDNLERSKISLENDENLKKFRSAS